MEKCNQSYQNQLSEQAKTIEQLKQEIAEYKHKEAALAHQIEKLLNSDRQALNRSSTEELQQALNFDAMLKRITDKVRDSLNESHILQTAVQELVRVLDLRGCNVALYNTSRAESTILR